MIPSVQNEHRVHKFVKDRLIKRDVSFCNASVRAEFISCGFVVVPENSIIEPLKAKAATEARGMLK